MDERVTVPSLQLGYHVQTGPYLIPADRAYPTRCEIMRLLRRSKTGEFSLTEDLASDKKTPPQQL